MLYAMQDATVRALAPVAALADIGSWFTGFVGPAFFPMHHEAQASFRLLTRLTKTYDKPKFDIKTIDIAGKSVAVYETVEASLPFCTLRHFSKNVADPGPRLLIVAPLSGHHSTLLRGTVQALLEQHDVYITDWTDARQIPLAKGKFDLSDYTEYLQSFIRQLGGEIHVLAVCQPCIPALAAVSLMEQRKEPLVPLSLTLISGPVDVRSNPTAVNRFATERDLSYFENKIIETVPLGYAGYQRKVYPGFKQLAGFVMMNQDKHKQAYEDYFRAVRVGDTVNADKHEKFYDEYNAVLDMPAEFYLETIDKIFLKPQLALGELVLCGELVDLAAIQRTALLTVEGDQDDITGLGQTHAAQSLCSSLPQAMRKRLTAKGVGHYGAFSGSKFRAQILPNVSDFIRDNGQ